MKSLVPLLLLPLLLLFVSSLSPASSSFFWHKDFQQERDVVVWRSVFCCVSQNTEDMEKFKLFSLKRLLFRYTVYHPAYSPRVIWRHCPGLVDKAHWHPSSKLAKQGPHVTIDIWKQLDIGTLKSHRASVGSRQPAAFAPPQKPIETTWRCFICKSNSQWRCCYARLRPSNTNPIQTVWLRSLLEPVKIVVFDIFLKIVQVSLRFSNKTAQQPDQPTKPPRQPSC